MSQLKSRCLSLRHDLIIHLQTDSLFNAFCKILIITVAFLNGSLKSTDRAVRRFEQEHRLSRFLGHRHQGSIILQQPQPVLILPLQCRRRRDIKHSLCVCLPGSIQPPLMLLYRSAAKRRVPRDNVPDRLHRSVRQLEAQIFRRSVLSVLPFISPGSQSWSEVFHGADRIEIGADRNDHEIGCYQCAPIYCAETRGNIYQANVGFLSRTCRSERSIECCCNHERASFVIQTAKPLARQLILDFRQPQVARYQGKPDRR